VGAVAENYFDERIAATYEAKWPELFDPAVVDPAVSFLEVIVPELERLPPGETVRAFTVTPRHLGFDEYDVAAQGVISHHYWVDNGELETFSAPFRHVWPSELDLMARLAGMKLRERWSGWRRQPFTSNSVSQVSVWEKTGPE